MANPLVKSVQSDATVVDASRDWSELPRKMVRAFVSLLDCNIDHMNVAAQCTSWRDALGHDMRARQLPWMLVPCGYVIVNLKSRVQDREAAFAQIMRDYFVDCSLYSEEDFWRRSPVFDNFAAGQRPQTEFHVNGTKYNMTYYLADGIYPDWATLVKTYSEPVSQKKRIYAETQESARKDVERAFGVLRSKFRIIYITARLWSHSDLNNIIRACVILHNMVIEDERNLYSDHQEFERSSDPPISQNRDVPEISQLIKSYAKIRDKVVSNILQKDLMEHIWQLYVTNRQGR
ncbi:uncharacterized protein LOC112903566 [Panicum hallii]|uniref:uncharacterized protein LOC112903566 n=1 Tax=Panicum hallii TaxID=206008 RepID=UPI000DF4E827|nr:uncharacterized protein LOC112903566 [Panicum hallii]